MVFAATAWMRLRGLLLRRPEWLGECGVLVLAPCASVHTFGMRTVIDVAFLARDGTVLKTVEALRPCRIVGCRGAVMVLERFAPAAFGDVAPWPRAGQRVVLCAPSG